MLLPVGAEDSIGPEFTIESDMSALPEIEVPHFQNDLNRDNIFESPCGVYEVVIESVTPSVGLDVAVRVEGEYIHAPTYDNQPTYFLDIAAGVPRVDDIFTITIKLRAATAGDGAGFEYEEPEGNPLVGYYSHEVEMTFTVEVKPCYVGDYVAEITDNTNTIVMATHDSFYENPYMF
jgi:hypothetical protein